MAICVLYDAQLNSGCLFCTTTDTAFGPVFENLDDAAQLERFVDWARSQGEVKRDAESLRTLFEQFLAHSDQDAPDARADVQITRGAVRKPPAPSVERAQPRVHRRRA